MANEVLAELKFGERELATRDNRTINMERAHCSYTGGPVTWISSNYRG